MNHFLSIEKTDSAQIQSILELSNHFLSNRLLDPTLLKNQQWGLIFTKSSTRTRVSFEVGIRELGGQSLFLSSADIQLGRGEPIQDTARVLGRMIHGAVIRTYAQSDVETFAQYSNIPTINALTDDEHPCQIIADLLTIQNHFKTKSIPKIAFLGDGDCNMARSWIWASAKLNFELVIGAPKPYQPQASFLKTLPPNLKLTITDDPHQAVKDCEIIYTDVWVSMGKEEEAQQRLQLLQPWQVNQNLLQYAKPNAIVMHCLPAYRGKEIDHSTLESHADIVFQQAENRLHAQKAIISSLIKH
jgi:ornithine carbamoyltransferase